MSWIGKILAVMGMLLALVLMWFTASTFAARTNWKVQADNYKKVYEDAKAAREAEYRTNQSERDALARQVKTEQSRADGFAVQFKKAEADVAKVTADLADLTKADKERAALVSELQANAAANQARADKLQGRVNGLEDEKIKLTITAEQAVKDKQAAETLARQAQQDKLNADKKAEDLAALLADEKSRGFGGGGSDRSLFGVRPVPIREGTRGTVESYKGGLLQITLGIDHGVTTGATLDVFRTGADAKYLGTVVIDRAYPQQSVGTFRPADPRRRLDSLRADELPKAGDRVGRVGAVSAGP